VFTTTRTCFAAVVAICLLGGCSKEAPRKTESSETPAAPQPTLTQQEKTQSGAELFRQFCFNCHPDGGNVSDTKRTLHGSDLRKNHITKAEDIVTIMRNPISRMIRFDAGTISDKDARTIAEYILNNFK
jgi:mono/diheme cytochrome c family protein